MAPRSQAIAADNAKSEKRKKSKQKTGDGADTGKKSKKRNNAFGGRAPPQLDPLLLARGMSSRYLSSKVSHKLTPLSKEAVEKDLRHMDAYRNACNGYNQQLFVFMNQGLVRSGYFGTFAPIPGADGDVIQPAMSATSKFSMPIKIDPEEEKRLSLLRKKIHQSEFDREKLETEYLSLRAHYVHESQLVRKTRSYEMGRWKLLKEVMTRRGKVLGLMRAKIAMGRDIESLLKYRGDLADKVKIGKIDIEVKDEDPPKNGDAPVSMNGGVMSSSGTGAASEEKKVVDTTPVKVVDIVQIWNTINTQLQEAEKACVEFETPAVLSQMVASSSDMASNGSRSRSPIRSDSDSGKGRKRSSSVTSEAESTTPTKKSKGAIPSELEPHVIPWDCMIEPQTPYEVPLLLSCLSSATDRAVGYLTDKTNPTAITWLGSTLPETTAAYDADAQDLAKLREEARILESELKRESERNTELQTRIIASRSRSDEMVALMQLVRSETEAVLERHNVIMETPEARAKSAELHKKLLEEAAAAGEDEEEEESSSGDEDMQGGNEEEERSDDDSVGIKEITVDKDNNNAAGESDDDNDGGSDDDVGEEEEEEPRRRTTRHSQPDDEDSSMTSPNQNSNNKKRRR